MRTFYLVLFSFIAMTTFGQNTPVMSKVTADWCPSCGSWGWELMEELKSEFEDGPGFVLGVHHSGDLSNPTSEWWKDVLNSSGQPRFYMNNERLSVSSGNWSDEIDNVVTQAADLLATGGSVDFSHDRILMEGQTLNVTVNVSAFPSNGEYYIGNYVYEDNVVAFQSQQGSDASHPNVLRSTMGPDYPGNIITANGVMEFIMDIPSEWNRDELGVLTVAWEKNGDNFNILGAAAVDMVSQISSSEDILDEELFTFSDNPTDYVISTKEAGQYMITLTDLSGRQKLNQDFEQEFSIDKSSLITGNYIITINSGKSILSRQVFIK